MDLKTEWVSKWYVLSTSFLSSSWADISPCPKTKLQLRAIRMCLCKNLLQRPPPVLCGVIYFTSVYMTQFAAVNGTFQDLSIVLTCLSCKHLKTVESFMTPWKEQEKESSEVSDCFTYIAKDTSHQ